MTGSLDSGQCTVGIGPVGSGQWTGGSELCREGSKLLTVKTAGSIQWTWTINSGHWTVTVGSGQWTVDSGQRAEGRRQ